MMRQACIGLLLLCATLSSAHASPITTPHFNFVSDTENTAVSQQLANQAERVLARVSATLGVDPVDQPTIWVSVSHGKKAFAQALPRAGSMVEWAAGVAIPSENKIFLRVDSDTQLTLYDVFVHEVSHIVLARAAGHKRLPRWFVEGVAVHQAGERILERWQLTTYAELTDSLYPLSALDSGFPGDASRVNLAYAQSTAFVGFLLEQHGWTALRTVIARVKSGTPFPEALRSVFGVTLSSLDRSWRREVSSSATWIPWLTNDSLLWVLMSVLFVMAWWVTKQRNKRRLATMDPEPSPLDDEFA